MGHFAQKWAKNVQKLLVFALLNLTVSIASAQSCSQTANFTCCTGQNYSKAICDKAEEARRRVSLAYLGYEMPRWRTPCPINVRFNMNSRAGGASSFAFSNNAVIGQQMVVEGQLNDIFNNVIPHEVTHTVLVNYHGRPIPRWLDEGTATCEESPSEQARYDQELQKINKLIPFRQFTTMDYPKNNQDIPLFYSQSHSVVKFLLTKGDKKRLVVFTSLYLRTNIETALKTHYSYNSLQDFETEWKAYCWPRWFRGNQTIPQQPYVPQQPYPVPQNPVPQNPVPSNLDQEILNLKTEILNLKTEIENLKNNITQQIQIIKNEREPGLPGPQGPPGPPGPQGPAGPTNNEALILLERRLTEQIDKLKDTLSKLEGVINIQVETVVPK